MVPVLQMIKLGPREMRSLLTQLVVVELGFAPRPSGSREQLHVAVSPAQEQRLRKAQGGQGWLSAEQRGREVGRRVGTELSVSPWVVRPSSCRRVSGRAVVEVCFSPAPAWCWDRELNLSEPVSSPEMACP